MDGWPLEEALVRPAVSLALSVAVPFGTAALLRWVYLGDLPGPGDERARRLVPFRRAAFIVGLGQLQLAWMLGATGLGPVFVEDREVGSLAFGTLCAVAAFVAGGVARRIEEPAGDRSTVLGTILLRLRLLPFFVGPIAVAAAAAQLPLAGDAGVRWGFVALAIALSALGAAFGGLVLAVATGGLLPARADLRALAREVARREGTSLGPVLRLPTGGTRFANAAALPWARTLVVADRTTEILNRDELRAVLAHEAGHLSEKPGVVAARLGAVTLALFAVTSGPALASTLSAGSRHAALGAAVLLALLLVPSLRRLARRMEERADARAAETAGPAPLASALRRIHGNAQLPMVTGRRRLHPDLYDRLVALGEDPGPRPPGPPRGGTWLGLAIAIGLVVTPVAVHALTGVPPAEVPAASEAAARWRLHVDPWDGEAMLALAWHARRARKLDLAEARARLAARMGPDAQGYWLLRAELHAARGDCDASRAAFERSLEAQAARVFDDGMVDRRLELGHYALPPSLVRNCVPTVGEAFGEPGEGDARIHSRTD